MLVLIFKEKIIGVIIISTTIISSIIIILTMIGKVEINGIRIEAVPAHNINKKFHPQGFGVGYIIDIGGTRIYHAGDTDFIPEMKSIKTDIALLPIGGTYTMDEAEAAEAANAMNPKIVVPMHFGTLKGLEGNIPKFRGLVKNSEVVVLDKSN